MQTSESHPVHRRHPVLELPPLTEVKRVVREYRGPLYTKVRSLDDVAFDLEVRTRDLTWRLDRAAAILQDHETVRWYTGLCECEKALLVDIIIW